MCTDKSNRHFEERRRNNAILCLTFQWKPNLCETNKEKIWNKIFYLRFGWLRFTACYNLCNFLPQCKNKNEIDLSIVQQCTFDKPIISIYWSVCVSTRIHACIVPCVLVLKYVWFLVFFHLEKKWMQIHTIENLYYWFNFIKVASIKLDSIK